MMRNWRARLTTFLSAERRVAVARAKVAVAERIARDARHQVDLVRNEALMHQSLLYDEIASLTRVTIERDARNRMCGELVAFRAGYGDGASLADAVAAYLA